jgi:hypothetical protein
MLSVYILRLANAKFYVGRSINIQRRMRDIFVGGYRMPYWTRKHKPNGILYVFPNCDQFDEDKITKMMMSRFGIDNVRGGSYSKVNLSPEDKKLIIKEIRGAFNLCFKCGSRDHWSTRCNITSNNIPNIIR